MRLPFLALWSQTKRPTQRFTEVWYLSEKSLEHRGRSVFPFSWYQPILGEKGNTATSSNYLVILKIPSNSRRVTVHDWNSSIIFQWMGPAFGNNRGGKLGFAQVILVSMLGICITLPGWRKKTNIKGPTSILLRSIVDPSLTATPSLIKLSSLELEKSRRKFRGTEPAPIIAQRIILL